MPGLIRVNAGSAVDAAQPELCKDAGAGTGRRAGTQQTLLHPPLVEYVQLTSLYAAHLASLYTNGQLHLSLSMSEQTHGNVPAAPCPIMRSVRRQ